MAAKRARKETTERDPLDVLAEEYAWRCRRGERPTVEEYAARHPGLAVEIRELLPAVAFLERGKGPGALSGPGPRSGLGAGYDGAAGSDAPAVRRLGENRVIRELGRGGMGVVYEAVQEPLGRRVAVKVLPRHAHGDATSRQRFLREARVVARLRHPNIVPIHAVGEHEGLPYYVMPLVDGSGLDRLLAGPPAAVPATPAGRARWVAGLGRQAAEALAYAHGQNVLHRDIKPANLLLDSSGTLWLADFGLAKLADDLSLTTTGELPGTLRYLAPECLHSPADARSDIYSLGLTLYELLVGLPAFPEVDRVRLLRQIESSQARAPRQVVPALPRDIETIVLKAMAHAPSSRYATAAELAADLRRFLDGRPVHARRVMPAERLVRWVRRNPAVAALVGTSLALGVSASVLLRLHLLAPTPPSGGPVAATRQAGPGSVAPPPAVVASPAGPARPLWEPDDRPPPPFEEGPDDGPPPRHFRPGDHRPPPPFEEGPDDGPPPRHLRPGDPGFGPPPTPSDDGPPPRHLRPGDPGFGPPPSDDGPPPRRPGGPRRPPPPPRRGRPPASHDAPGFPPGVPTAP